MTNETRKLKTGTLHRAATFERASVDEQARTVELAFSSEAPVARWFGAEVLDHSPASIRMDRIRNSGPVLLDHDTSRHIGVVQSVEIGQDRVGRAVVRFGKSAAAQEAFQDVVDGIRQHISVGYRVHKMVLERKEEDEETCRATDWEPLEISLVAVPADATVGVGRAAPEPDAFETEI